MSKATQYTIDVKSPKEFLSAKGRYPIHMKFICDQNMSFFHSDVKEFNTHFY